jgi:PAS domain-containing protein
MEQLSATGTPGPASAITHQVADLRRLIDQLQGGTAEAAPAPADEAVQHLETAYEELRVAEEEVRVQQEQITEMLGHREQLHQEHERMLAALPVPVLQTDLEGIVRMVGGAAPALLQARVEQLVGKPLTTLFAPADRPAVRRALTALREGGQDVRSSVVLTDGHTSVELSGARVVGDDRRITWMLTTVHADGRDPGEPHPDLPAALVTLVTLPAQTTGLQALLSEAAHLCRRGFGGRGAVSISTGSPLGPDASAATSQLAQTVDGVQLVAGGGPSAQAFGDVQTTWTARVDDDPRWPELRGQVPEGVVGVLAAPLRTGTVAHGVLAVYLPAPPRVPQDVEAVELLAATTTAVLREVGLRADLRALSDQMARALTSRAVIDQAKGIIMGDRGWDADRAFAHLVSLSSANGLKVRDVAQALVDQLAHDDESDRPSR